MTKYLLDTNHIGHAVAAKSPLLNRILEGKQSGDRFGTCIPVLCEIEVGRLQVNKPDIYQQLLNKLLNDMIKIWPLTKQTSQNYGEIYCELKAKGCAMSQVDMIVSAMARESRLVVLTSDRDFEALPDIKTENWL